MNNKTLKRCIIVQLIQSVTHGACFREFKLPLVGMPIQLRYRVSFLEMYVFPRAGRPTITMTVGGLAKWGAPAAAKKGRKLQCVFTDRGADRTSI